jgi:Restriction Endonuclease associating with ARP
MSSKYQEAQRAKSIKLIQDGSPVFYGSSAGHKFMGKSRNFVLMENMKNLFAPISKDVVKYFLQNKVSWWGGSKPTGHVLSSQIACLNHLFMIRNDRNAVLSILKIISPDFKDILQIETDYYSPAFIQFESVSDNDNLNEGVSNRGSNCTSIDAMIYAVHNDGSNWLIPIEWKYTEHYNNQNKATEGCKKDPENCKGKVRTERYEQLINDSKQLIGDDHGCYYYEPFYQLMRQTLWAEQMIKNSHREKLKASNYLHVHVIPSENSDLLEKEYRCSKKNMETTWRDHLKDQSKYLIITPKKLLSGLNDPKYEELLDYLNTRY